MSFSKIGLVKGAAKLVVGLGVGKIVKDVIKNNVSAPESVVSKVTIYAATSVIVAVATTHTDKYVDDAIDGLIKVYDAVVKKKDQTEDPESDSTPAAETPIEPSTGEQLA